MTLQELNLNYVYKADKRFDTWQEMQSDADGKYTGDCEDYAITLKKHIPEFKDWDYYYCKLNGIGHCILYKNGNVIDCNIKGIVTLEQYNMLYKPTDLRKYNWFTIFSKVLVSRVYTRMLKWKFY